MSAFHIARDLAVVALGGAIGSVARYGVGMAVAAAIPSAFPWGILIVNVVGCLTIGVLGEWFTLTKLAPEWWRLLLVTGFLGGLTTFSSFGYDTYRQLSIAEYGAALANIAANVTLGLTAVWIGVVIVREWLS